MTSDDTEHACMTAQALLLYPSDYERFASSLAWKLRGWLVGLPAGIGLATLRSIAKLWVGFPPSSSGVYSAGNGPAMRSPIIGLAFATDPAKLREYVAASTRLTHSDPRAERGALAIALAVRYGATHSRETFSREELLRELEAVFPVEDKEAHHWSSVLRRAVGEKWDEEAWTSALHLERGVTGYMYHTVPSVLWAWLRDPFDFPGCLERIIGLGGDADTSGAIAGALCGATAGVEAIPRPWIEGIIEFPRTVVWVETLATRLYEARSNGARSKPLPLAWPWLLVRNPLFLLCVLLHGFRRLLPPY